MRKAFLGLLLSLAVAVPASAAPNWLGQTGLLLTPTADALNDREWNLTFHHISDQANIAAVNVGLLRGLEAGLVYFDPDFRGADEEFTGRVKYVLLPERAESFGLAIGWWDFADQIDSTPYGVLSKRVTEVDGRALRVHVGGGGGIYDGIFAGADLNLTDNLLAMLEYDGDDLNAGVRLGLAQGFRIDAGLVSDEFGIGASYNARF